MTLRYVRIILCCLLLGSAHNVLGQRYGLRGGIQETNLVADETSETFGTETGLSLGGFLGVNLPANLALSAEGLYTQKIVTQQDVAGLEGGGIEEANPDVTLELGTIEIPITLAWRANLTGPLYSRLYGGPIIGIIVDEQVEVNDRPVADVFEDAYERTREAFTEREVGWLVGGGLTLSLSQLGFGNVHLLADVRYHSGITSIEDDFAGNPLSQQIRVGAITGMLGIGF